MNITHTPGQDFAVSRFAASTDDWLTNAFTGYAKGDNEVLQTLYDERTLMQRDEDGYDDWDAYLASGLTPLADQPTPELPSFPVLATPDLSPRQLRLALLSTGTTETDVDAMISAITDDQERAWSQIEWKHATSFARNHALIESFGMALGYTDTQIDALWIWALEL